MTDLSRIRIEPLQAEVDGIGRYQSAFDVGDLASMLMNRWPQQAKGRAFNYALVVCPETFERQQDGTTARSAFVSAAREADVSILPDDVPKLWSATK